MERQRPQEGTADRAASSLGPWGSRGSLSQGICHNNSHTQGSHVWTNCLNLSGEAGNRWLPGFRAYARAQGPVLVHWLPWEARAQAPSLNPAPQLTICLHVETVPQTSIWSLAGPDLRCFPQPPFQSSFLI